MENLRKKFIDALKCENTAERIMDMDKLGELEKIFPHIKEMKKIGKCRFHAVDSFTHSINALKEFEYIKRSDNFLPKYIREIVKDDMETVMDDGMKKEELLKFALFLHDMGKPASLKLDKDGNAHFKGHETVGANMVHSVISGFGLCKTSEDLIYSYVKNHMQLLILYKTNDLSKNIIYGIFEYLGDDVTGVMLIGYSDIVCTRRLIYENENYGVLRVYMEYVLTNYYYRYGEE